MEANFWAKYIEDDLAGSMTNKVLVGEIISACDVDS
jgi:hypothetical protein